MSLGQKSPDAYDDVWMTRDFKLNGDPDYKYMLFYVDDLFRIGLNPKEDMDVLNMIYELNQGFGSPDQ